MNKEQDFAQQQRWIPFKNNAGEEIPPFAAMEVTDVYKDGSLKVIKPSANDLQVNIAFNGPVAVSVDKFGQCTMDYPLTAYTNLGGTGNVGTLAGQWYLDGGQTGFWVNGIITTSGTQYSIVAFFGKDAKEGV